MGRRRSRHRRFRLAPWRRRVPLTSQHAPRAAGGWSKPRTAFANARKSTRALEPAAHRPSAQRNAPGCGSLRCVNREGDPAVIRGLLREADRKALESSQRKARKGVAKPAAPDEVIEDQAPSPQRVASDISEALTRRLAAHRTAALQAVLAGNNQLALATLAHTLLRRAFIDDYCADRPAMQITATAASHALVSVADDLKAGRAFQLVEVAKAKWRERLPDQRAEWFGWLIALPQPELLDLLGLCATLTVNALPAAGATYDANAIASAAGLDMTDWWETDGRRLPQPCLEGADRSGLEGRRPRPRP